MQMHTTLSLRAQLNDAVVSFLKNEGMPCPKTRDGVVMLINALSHYREEGKELFPEVFVFDSLQDALKTLPESEYVEIGVEAKSADTMKQALKKCAPLARRGWAVYIERRPKAFAFGLFRCGSTALSLTPTELLINRGDPSIPVFMLRQIAENLIQVSGFSRSSLLVHFGATKDIELSPLPRLKEFITCITRDVPGEFQEQVAEFYLGVFSGVLRAGHGTLAAAVAGTKRAMPKAFKDGTTVKPQIAVVDRIKDVLEKTDCTSNTRLQASSALITGMLLSDGITVFGSDGSVRAYNAFVKNPKDGNSAIGGARARAFKVMSGLVGSDLIGAFMQSQDGRVDFCGKKQK